MFLALGAASSAIDLLKSLTGSSSAPAAATANGSAKTGFSVASADQLATANTTFGGSSPGTLSPGTLSPGTLTALFSAQQPGASTQSTRGTALQSLFSTLDADGSGGISKTEFENALGAGGSNTAKADEVFGKLDADGDGSVSLAELGGALKSGKGHRHHAGKAQDDRSQTDPLLQALDGASATASTNSDGSTTTSLTYADGSKVTLTTPAAPAATSTAASSYNVIAQAIQRQAQAISAHAKTSLSV